MHSTLGHDAGDARERLAGFVGYAAPAFCAGFARPVAERLGAGPEWATHDDPPDHPRLFVGDAVVVVDAGHGEPDLEVITRIHEVARVPGRRTLGDPERVVVVARVVRGRGVHVLAHYPAHGG